MLEFKLEVRALDKHKQRTMNLRHIVEALSTSVCYGLWIQLGGRYWPEATGRVFRVTMTAYHPKRTWAIEDTVSLIRCMVAAGATAQPVDEPRLPIALHLGEKPRVRWMSTADRGSIG